MIAELLILLVLVALAFTFYSDFKCEYLEGREDFCAFGGIPVYGGWGERGRAWSGWNAGPPWYPHSWTPSVWY